MKSVWLTLDNCGGCTLCLVKTDGVTPARLKLLMVYDAGLDFQLLTTHVQLKLTGSPPVQRSAAQTLEPPNQTQKFHSRANRRTNNKPNKPNKRSDSGRSGLRKTNAEEGSRRVALRCNLFDEGRFFLRDFASCSVDGACQLRRFCRLRWILSGMRGSHNLQV